MDLKQETIEEFINKIHNNLKQFREYTTLCDAVLELYKSLEQSNNIKLETIKQMKEETLKIIEIKRCEECIAELQDVITNIHICKEEDNVRLMAIGYKNMCFLAMKQNTISALNDQILQILAMLKK